MTGSKKTQSTSCIVDRSPLCSLKIATDCPPSLLALPTPRACMRIHSANGTVEHGRLSPVIRKGNLLTWRQEFTNNAPRRRRQPRSCVHHLAPHQLDALHPAPPNRGPGHVSPLHKVHQPLVPLVPGGPQPTALDEIEHRGRPGRGPETGRPADVTLTPGPDRAADVSGARSADVTADGAPERRPGECPVAGERPGGHEGLEHVDYQPLEKGRANEVVGNREQALGAGARLLFGVETGRGFRSGAAFRQQLGAFLWFSFLGFSKELRLQDQQPSTQSQEVIITSLLK